ncbi:hypothetical protein SKAU_G00368510 [Synaphobranchus kaupii]|uniref:Uncharacterized protein n=1 Tax=Synaphobranchus kaupii TaxID=118154 RepID=A0A9Q1EFK1_SYNKA|nr:hypothetical protein SKAU_G00368510 [Synaphobranchus kaupii]
MPRYISHRKRELNRRAGRVDFAQRTVRRTLHLYKEAVPVLAKTLKDVALNRNSTTSHRSNGQGPHTNTETHPKTLKQHTEQSRPAEA